ncbi:unnamed protein product [Periconia digitata]|uniref:Uncharacterized protein n=1 Tax=Periconia digitata TaxID=1303443 RepID=A0A9W4UQN9_9PLEO|nr:unnamed protein product [Periconia digitata]
MSKRDNEGEIISSKLAVAAAQQHESLFASLAGAPDATLFNSTAIEENTDEDLKDIYVDDEQFGVGAAIPKDIEDGSFTRRIPASDDKLLQQLLGKKAAKAHLARQATTSSAKPQVIGKPQRNEVKEESEDEEEGRASAFTSKRRKVAKKRATESGVESDGGEDGNGGAVRKENAGLASSAPKRRAETREESQGRPESQDADSNENVVRKSTAKSRAAVKPKAVSYLDELLAGRSKKKQKK